MNRNRFAEAATVCLSTFLCLPLAANAQGAARGDWSMTGGNAGQTGWQKAETKLAPDTIPTQFKFLWKIDLGAPGKAAQTFHEPLLASRLINAQGFKDFVYVTSSDTLYGVDSELGALLWKKQYAVPPGCGPAGISAIMEPPVVINFNARRAPGAPPPPQPGPLAPSARRLGVPAGGGGFGLKGIYALTSDGILHEQVLTTGVDFAPPVKFLPAAASPSGLNILGKTIYAANTRSCARTPAGAAAVDLADSTYPVAVYDTKVAPVALTGPLAGPDGTAYLVTGPGAGEHPSSILALGKDMKLKDWYTAPSGPGVFTAVTPVLFPWKTRQLIAAPGRDGSFVLLDAAAIGGADHHTPLSESPAVFKPGGKHPWDSLASWQAADGATWVLAAISGPVSSPSLKGAAPHGAIVAFKVEDADGKPVLTPAWISPDMVNPAPPRIANGVILALAGGDAKTHATLSVLNAATGQELYSSHDTIPTSTHLSGLAVGDGHVYFTDRNGVLYAFGIALEH